MKTSSRFPVAVHILTAIAVQNGTPVPSDMIADSVNSHPTVVRRLLTSLNNARITHARMGSGGGAVLARAANKISLLDIYSAVEEPGLFEFHRNGPNPNCMIGRSILPVLNCHLDAAKQAFESTLRATTLDTVVADVMAQGKISGGHFIQL